MNSSAVISNRVFSSWEVCFVLLPTIWTYFLYHFLYEPSAQLHNQPHEETEHQYRHTDGECFSILYVIHLWPHQDRVSFIRTYFGLMGPSVFLNPPSTLQAGQLTLLTNGRFSCPSYPQICHTVLPTRVKQMFAICDPSGRAFLIGCAFNKMRTLCSSY